jgi:hypothetical protein
MDQYRYLYSHFTCLSLSLSLSLLGINHTWTHEQSFCMMAPIDVNKNVEQ